MKINVGGIRFMTTIDTLKVGLGIICRLTLKSKGPNFLTLMVTNDRKGLIPALNDEKGYYFIDRSGTH